MQSKPKLWNEFQGNLSITASPHLKKPERERL